ncbi:MAG: hypothetical protein HY873_13135 [Chloroflexi bacterium]|nr:hypothetical protein [Chloroflexota bacterium]
MKVALSFIGAIALAFVAFAIAAEVADARPGGTTYSITMSDSTPNYGQTVTFGLSPTHPNTAIVSITVRCTQATTPEDTVVLNASIAPGGTVTFTSGNWNPTMSASCRATADDVGDTGDSFNPRSFTVAP